MMTDTFDCAPATLPAASAEIHVPMEMLSPVSPVSPVDGSKLRKPTFSMFAPLIDESAFVAVMHNNSADGFDIRLTTGNCAARVDYNGAHDGKAVEKVVTASKGRITSSPLDHVTWKHDGHITIDADSLRASFDYALAAASSDMTRSNLQAVHVWNGAVAASDGHRAHVTYASGLPTEWACAIPLHAVQFLVAALRTSKAETVRLGMDGRTFFARVKGGGFDVIVSAVTEKPFMRLFEHFEEYAADARRDKVSAFVGDAVSMRTLLRQTPVETIVPMHKGKELSPVTVRHLTFMADGALILGRTYAEEHRVLGTYAETLPTKTVTVAVNPKYLADTLAHMDGEVFMTCGSEFDPVMFRAGDQRALIMPIRP